MKPRARRIALLTVAAGCLVVGGLVVAHWSAVRDHVEAWRFQATRETQMTVPSGAERAVFGILAASSGRPVIFARDGNPLVPIPGFYDRVGESVLDALRRDGWRIVEQRFPRPAYVVVGYPKATQ